MLQRFVAVALLSGAFAVEYKHRRKQVDTRSIETTFIVEQGQVRDEHGGYVGYVSRVPMRGDLEAHEMLAAPLRCIVTVCCYYLAFYATLSLCRTYQEFMGVARGKFEAGLRAATQALMNGPMICVVFLALSVRVNLPSDEGWLERWMQQCMYALTFAVFVNAVLALIEPIALKQEMHELEEIDSPKLETQHVLYYALTALRFLTLLVLYGGLAGFVVVARRYSPHDMASYLIMLYDTGDQSDTSTQQDMFGLAPTPAVTGTLILAVIFCAMRLAVAMCNSYTEYQGFMYPRVIGVMNAAVATTDLAPLLSSLFLGSEVCALHNTRLQDGILLCVYVSIVAFCILTLLAILIPALLGGTWEVVKDEEAEDFHVSISNRMHNAGTLQLPTNPAVKVAGLLLVFIRLACVFILYFAIAYLCFISATRHPRNSAWTPTLLCIVNLACQFFCVYLLVVIVLTLCEIGGGKVTMDTCRFCHAMDNARATLEFAPMLSVLFLAVSMAASQSYVSDGGVPLWVQDGMYMAAWSSMIVVLFSFVTGLAMRSVQTDVDGNAVHRFRNRYLGMIMIAFRCLTMLMLYSGAVVVIVGLCTLAPTITGHALITEPSRDKIMQMHVSNF